MGGLQQWGGKGKAGKHGSECTLHRKRPVTTQGRGRRELRAVRFAAAASRPECLPGPSRRPALLQNPRKTRTATRAAEELSSQQLYSACRCLPAQTVRCAEAVEWQSPQVLLVRLGRCPTALQRTFEQPEKTMASKTFRGLQAGYEKTVHCNGIARSPKITVTGKLPSIRLSVFYVSLEDFSTPMRHSTPNIRIIF